MWSITTTSAWSFGPIRNMRTRTSGPLSRSNGSIDTARAIRRASPAGSGEVVRSIIATSAGISGWMCWTTAPSMLAKVVRQLS